VIYRLPLLRSRNELDSWLSREYAFLLNNWILLGCALFILTATMFPTLSEWLAHDRITVGPPFFTKALAPVGLVLLFLTGVGPLIAWRKASVENLKQQFLLPTTAGVLTAIVLGALTPLRGWSEWTIRGVTLKFPLTASVICFALAGFVTTTIAQEFYRGARVRQTHTKLDFFTSLIGLVARGKRRYGGYLVHIAIVLMFVGFAGDAYKTERDFVFDSTGQKVSLGHYELTYRGITQSSAPDKDMTTATVEVMRDGKPFATLHPAKWYFRHHEDEPPTSEVDIHKTLGEDLYIVLNAVQNGSASVKVVINPLVDWIWLGFLLLIVGTVIAFLPDRAYALAGAAAKSDKGKAAAATAILFMLLSGGNANAQAAMEQVQQGTLMHTPRNAHERVLFAKYKCLCGTCSHSLEECVADGCGSGEMRRVEIQQLLDSGMTDDAINSFEIGKYGEETLRIPLDTGYRRLVWVLPVAALLGAAGVLVAVARRSSAKHRAPNAPVTPAEPTVAADDEYQSRLDDELDELD
ncbi:MAG: ccmF, partial [bacterium]|nr:ccmF [bacterium]